MAQPLIADRVQETSTTTGTGTFNLDGATTGYQTFVAGVGDGNECFYTIAHRSADEWEVGIGTVTDATPDNLSRDTILESSNSDSAVNFAAGTKDVFIVAPQVLQIPRTENLCLNPGYESVLPGAHTTTIKELTSAGEQNSQFPGWKIFCDATGDDITADVDQTTYSTNMSDQACKLTDGAMVTGSGIRQVWKETTE